MSAVALLAAAGTSATAGSRAGWALLERQWPFALVALALVLLLLVFTALQLRGRRSEPAPAGAPVPLGALWTLLPVLLVAALVVLSRTAPVPAGSGAGAPIEVRVVGHQWWWEFRYPALGVVTATDLHLPAGRPVRMTVESADVSHSFWVPAIGPRQDVPPLSQRTFEFTPDREGIFPGQCAELCGASHAHMHLKMFVEPPAVFEAWVQSQLAPPFEPDSVRGGELWAARMSFVRNACRGCHTIRGVTEGPIGPDLTHFASRTTIAGGMFERTDENLTQWILHANKLKSGSTMPGFPVPERQLGPLVRYLQSLK